jgi:hypothetical protein
MNCSDLLLNLILYFCICSSQKKKGGWPKGKKRRKTLRDVNAPRAPLTAYVQFLNENRDKVRAEHPDLPFPEITKLLGAQWSKMSQEDKQVRKSIQQTKRLYIFFLMNGILFKFVISECLVTKFSGNSFS